MRRYGGGRSTTHHTKIDLLSPTQTQHNNNEKPEWWHALFPALPHAHTEPDDDEEDDEDAALAAPYFPTPESIRSFIALQGVRLQLLTRIMHSLIGGESQTRAKYVRMQLDVALLSSILHLFDFSSHVSELVHTCSPTELATLQTNNLKLIHSMLSVLRAMMVNDELQIDIASATAATTPTPPPFVSVADRLCAHNSAEVLLSIFEHCIDETELICDEPADSAGAQLHSLQCSVLEGVLRCLLAQLEHVTPDSSHRINLLKELYLHIPSPLQSAPSTLLAASPGQGSDSEIIRLLIALVSRRSNPLSVLSAAVLNHIATTPVPNEHVHSKTVCGNSENSVYTSPLCTRGAPPAPVVTFPLHENSTLAVASKLFLFPLNPALYLIERGLMLEYLEQLQPMLGEHESVKQDPAVLPFAASRSLFRSDATNSDDEVGESRSLSAVLPLPTSPLIRPLRQVFSHVGDESHAHHASFRQDAFMDAKYATPRVNDHSAELELLPEFPEFSLAHSAAVPTKPQSTSSPPVASAPAPLAPSCQLPLHQSKELAGAVLGGLSALATRNAAVSAFLCSQSGLLPFLAQCLTHPQLQFSLLAAELVVEMSSALAFAASHAREVGSTGVSIASLNVASLRPARSLSRRNSESGCCRVPPKLHRRNSREVASHHSPQIMPSSPSHFKLTHSPKLTAIGGPMHPHAPPALGFSEAHKLLSPLVDRVLQTLLGLVTQRWGGNKTKVHKHANAVLSDMQSQIKVLRLLAKLTSHSEQLQAESAAAVPLLVSLLSSRSLAASVHCACIISLSALCSRHVPNRQVILTERVLDGSLLQLLGALQLMSDNRSQQPAHPMKLALRLAIVQLCTQLSASFHDKPVPLSSLIADVASTSGCMLSQLLLFLDSPFLTLRVASAALVANLLLPHSPVRDLLVQAAVIPKLARMSEESSSWTMPSLPPLPDALDVECHAAAPASLPHQLRIYALCALCNVTAQASHETKFAVLSELSLDGLLALLTSEESHGDGGMCDCSAELEQQGWILLRHLLQPSVSASKEESVDPPLLSSREITRVLDLIISRAEESYSSAPRGGSFAQLLAAIASRPDRSSKSLICARPSLLSMLYAALQEKAGDGAKWSSICLQSLLKPAADDEPTVKPSVVPMVDAAPAAAITPLASRVHHLLNHAELFPQLLRIASQASTECASPDRDVRKRLQQCLLLMYEINSASGVPSDRGVLLEECATALKAAALVAPPVRSVRPAHRRIITFVPGARAWPCESDELPFPSRDRLHADDDDESEDREDDRDLQPNASPAPASSPGIDFEVQPSDDDDEDDDGAPDDGGEAAESFRAFLEALDRAAPGQRQAGDRIPELSEEGDSAEPHFAPVASSSDTPLESLLPLSSSSSSSPSALRGSLRLLDELESLQSRLVAASQAVMAIRRRVANNRAEAERAVMHSAMPPE